MYVCAEIVRQLVALGVVFTADEEGQVDLRAFGGQTNRRTAYAGASTGKQIVSALTRKCREYEAAGLVKRNLGSSFPGGLIKDGTCTVFLSICFITATLYSSTYPISTRSNCSRICV